MLPQRHGDAQAAHTFGHSCTRRVHRAVWLGTHFCLTDGDAVKVKRPSPFDAKASVRRVGAVELLRASVTWSRPQR